MDRVPWVEALAVQTWDMSLMAGSGMKCGWHSPKLSSDLHRSSKDSMQTRKTRKKKKKKLDKVAEVADD